MFGRPPAEADIQRHFRVSPPSVHQMIVTLERNGFIRRQPGVPRSIEILMPPESLPILEWLGIKTTNHYDEPLAPAGQQDAAKGMPEAGRRGRIGIGPAGGKAARARLPTL